MKKFLIMGHRGQRTKNQRADKQGDLTPATRVVGLVAAGLLLVGCASAVIGSALPAADLSAPGLSTGSDPSDLDGPSATPEDADGSSTPATTEPPAETTPADDLTTDLADDPNADAPSSAEDGGSGAEPSGQIPDVDPNDWYPTEDNQDPSVEIEGIFLEDLADYGSSYQHVSGDERVAYQYFPPMGGSHDSVWAPCNGVAYDVPVRNENMVHGLEHGAVWIAYNPDTLAEQDIADLKALVVGQDFLVVSPYPDLQSPLSLQSWGHQLALDSPWDERLYQFVYALRQNQYLTPELGATCDQPTFDVDNPPAFDRTPPGPDAYPLGSDPEDGTTDGAVPDDSGDPDGSGGSGEPDGPGDPDGSGGSGPDSSPTTA